MRISKKQVYKAFYVYQVKKKVNEKKHLWQGLDYWSIYTREGRRPYKWKSEIKFRSNKEVYNFIKGDYNGKVRLSQKTLQPGV